MFFKKKSSKTKKREIKDMTNHDMIQSISYNKIKFLLSNNSKQLHSQHCMHAILSPLGRVQHYS